MEAPTNSDVKGQSKEGVQFTIPLTSGCAEKNQVRIMQYGKSYPSTPPEFEGEVLLGETKKIPLVPGKYTIIFGGFKANGNNFVVCEGGTAFEIQPNKTENVEASCLCYTKASSPKIQNRLPASAPKTKK